MARTIPTVQHDVLIGLTTGEQHRIAVETSSWYDWLASASRFAFVSNHGTFTAYKERSQRGGWYWKAYRRRAGKLHRAYLGKSECLTLERLRGIAAQLAGQGAPSAAVMTHTRKRSASGVGTHTTLGHPTTTLHRSQVGPLEDPLLATKLHIPAARPGLVPRPRLTEQISLRTGCRLTLISAPAGFGKTTLLSEWCARSPCPVAWVSLDEGDNDPVRFWRYLLTALERLHPAVGKHTLLLLQPAAATTVEPLITPLINALDALNEPLALILDDYQVIQTAAIHQGLAFLLEHAPACLQVIIASRGDPPLPLARLRVREQLRELRAADLRFTLEEVQTFFVQKNDLRLSAEALAALEVQTEGWPAALHLAALSLRGQTEKAGLLRIGTSGSQRSMAEYLLLEVLQQQPEPVQAFLLQTSVLDRLSGSLCEAVTGQTGGQMLLQHLERANLFLVPLDAGGQWYRYHHLFAEFLRTQVQQAQPEQIPRLHLRAANWYERHELPAEAIRHALAAGDGGVAGRLIEQTAERVIQRGELSTLRQWLDALPEDQLARYPRLCLLQARALITNGQVDLAEARLRQAEQGMDNSAAPLSGEPAAHPNAMLGEIAAIRAEIAAMQGDLPRALAFSQQALQRLPEDQSFLRASVAANLGTIYAAQGEMVAGIHAYALARNISAAAGNMPAVVGSLSSEGYLLTLQGRLAEAATRFQQALEMATGQDPLPPLACMAYCGLGRILYEWNHLDAALDALQRGMELSQQRGDIQLLIRGYAQLANIKLLRGADAEAEEFLRHLDHLAYTSHSPVHAALAAVSSARLWLARGDLARATHWARMSGLQPTDQLSYLRESGHLMLARVLLAQGRHEEAAMLLERLRSAAENGGRHGRVIEMLVLQALTFQAMGMTTQALDTLAQALALGETGGYMRLFLDEGAPLAALLAKLLRMRRTQTVPFPQQGSLSYLRKLVAGTPLPASPTKGAAQAGISLHQADLLSQREHEILCLVAIGKSNQDIAAALVIEPSTVTWHLKQIYSKLDVHSRTQAIAQARAWDLL